MKIPFFISTLDFQRKEVSYDKSVKLKKRKPGKSASPEITQNRAAHDFSSNKDEHEILAES